MKPADPPSAWDFSRNRIKLDTSLGKASQDFNFDEILTGSENKPVYNAVARSHVYAAMDGFNAVIFAYGQTASGKTFTLVGRYVLVFRLQVEKLTHAFSLVTKRGLVSFLAR